MRKVGEKVRKVENMNPARHMKGEFIWNAGDPSPINSYMRFRKVFELSGKTQNAQLRIFVDSRYKLFINGNYIGFGPARFIPEYPEYDTYQTEDFLKEGKNCIAVLVHHYGVDNFQCIKRRGGLILDCCVKTENDQVRPLSDRSWKVSLDPCWDIKSPKMDIQLGFTEFYNAKDYHGWIETDYDDSNWNCAVNFKSVWGKLRERSIPKLGGAMISQVKPIKTGIVKNTAKVYNVQVGFLFDTKIRGGAFAYTHIYSPEEQSIILGFDENKNKNVWFNGEKLKLDKDEDTLSRQVVSVLCREGWNVLFIYMDGSWDHRFESNMSFLSGKGIFLSATKDEPDTFFVTDILTDDSLIQEIASHYNEPLKANVTWSMFICFCNNIALVMSWEDIKERPLLLQSLPVCLKEGEFMLFDFGREVFGCPIISLEVSEGSVIDIGYAEHLTNGRINPAKSMVWYTDRYITRSGTQNWELFSPRAFRYLEVVIRKAAHIVKLNDIKVREVLYPVNNIGKFECSDKLLNEIWNMGEYTTHLCMEDAYIDCPWRERAQWWGDARVEYLTNKVCFGDDKLMARGLRQIGASQLEDGHIYPIYPTPFNWIISDYSLIWVISIWDYYHHSGDEKLLRELFPRIKRLINYFEDRMDKTGLTISSTPAPLIDWADIDKRGAVTTVNAFFYKALIDGAKIASLCREEEVASRYLSLSCKLREVFNELLYDEMRGCYVDCLVEGRKSEKSSIHSNCLPLLFGMVPEKSKESVGGFIKTKLSNVFEKPDEPGWRGQVISPYFMFYALGSLYAAEEDLAALDEIRKHWKWMLEREATTCWENFTIEGSLCHAWASAPTYYLSTEVLGIKFPQAGNPDKVLIEPHPGDLRWAKGIVPHSDGKIGVEWHIDESGCINLTVRLLSPLEVAVRLPEFCKSSVHIEVTGE